MDSAKCGKSWRSRKNSNLTTISTKPKNCDYLVHINAKSHNKTKNIICATITKMPSDFASNSTLGLMVGHKHV